MNEELISCLIYNNNYTLLGIGSLDHSIKITTISTSTTFTIPKAHSSPILSLAFSSNNLLASGSSDALVKLWYYNQSNQKWLNLVNLIDSIGTIRSLSFCPIELGLKLAVISSDSILRLYESIDLINYIDWNLITIIDLLGPVDQKGNLIENGTEMNDHHDELPLLTPSTSSRTRTTTSSIPLNPLLPPPSSTSTSSSSSTKQQLLQQQQEGEGKKRGIIESEGAWSLSWCNESWWGERLAVTAAQSELIRLFHLPPHKPWKNFLTLSPPSSSSNGNGGGGGGKGAIASLSWSPASGRSFQLLAAGNKSGKVRIYKLIPSEPKTFRFINPTTTNNNNNGVNEGEDDDDEEEWKVSLDAELELDPLPPTLPPSTTDRRKSSTATTTSHPPSYNNNGYNLGKVIVNWNILGTVLSTAGEDGKVRLWKRTYTGQWRVVALLDSEIDDSPQ